MITRQKVSDKLFSSLWVIGVRAVDRDGFHLFEQSGWREVSGEYDEAFADLTSQVVTPLLEVARVRQGMRLLDVATGPGYVAAEASQRGAQVFGVDFSTAMVVLARKRFPSIEYCEGDAEDLPFASASFDGVTMNFGLLHLSRPERALAEAHRVLRPEGRVGFTVWCKPEEAVGFGIVLDAVQRHGRMDIPLPSGPPFFRFSDFPECRRTLLEAGFSMPEVVKVPQVWRLPSAKTLITFMEKGTVRTRGTLSAQSPVAMKAIRKAVEDGALAHKNTAGIELPMPAVLASAIKP